MPPPARSSRHGPTSRPLLVLAIVALVAVAVVVRRLWRNGARDLAIAALSVAVGAFVSLEIGQMGPTGAGAIGWPIVWSLPMFPLRAAGALSYHTAWYLGIALLLACNIVTVVATAAIARRLVSARVALIAPALLVIWPFLMRLVDGTGGVVYESWLNDSGLLLYAEPLSTALVAVAIATLVLRSHDPAATALAGALIAFATAVRLSNITIAVVLGLTLLLARRGRPLVSFVVSCAGIGLIAAVFWSRGYASFVNKPSEQAPHGLFSWHYLSRSWSDAVVFDWRLLLILLPLALLGAFALRNELLELGVLAGTVAVTAVFYSAYYITALHPRFLFVALPPLFVLIAAGVAKIMRDEREQAPKAP